MNDFIHSSCESIAVLLGYTCETALHSHSATTSLISISALNCAHSLSVYLPCYRLKQYCNRILQTCLSIYDCVHPLPALFVVVVIVVPLLLSDVTAVSGILVLFHFCLCVLHSSFSIRRNNGKREVAIASTVCSANVPGARTTNFAM